MNFTINNTSEVKNLANELINNGANVNNIVQDKNEPYLSL